MSFYFVIEDFLHKFVNCFYWVLYAWLL